MKKRRRLSGVTLVELGAAFYPRPISKSAVAYYESGEKALPFEYDADDYAAALTRAVHDKRAVA